MSRQELAEAVNAYIWHRYQRAEHLDHTDIGKLERGQVRWPRPQRREALRAVLGVAADLEIGLYLHRSGTEPTTDVEAVLDGGGLASETGEVDRGEFLRIAAAGLVSIVAPPLLYPWPDRSMSAPPAAGDSMLARLRASTEGFRWMDRREGAAGLVAHTTAHARLAVACWRSASGDTPTRSQLAEAAADACHLVAYQAYDQGARTSAIEWYRCAAELAAHARNKDLYVFAMCGVAYMHSRNHQPDLALPVLGQMSGLSLSAAARYYLAVYQAHAHSAAGDQQASLHALDKAARLADRHDQATPAPWLGMPDQMFVERQRGMILADLGARSGLDVLTWLDQHTPATFQRYRVTLLTNHAQLCAKLREPERSAAVLQQALRRNARTRSREKMLQMRKVRTILQPYEDAVDLREIDDQLNSYGRAVAPLASRP